MPPAVRELFQAEVAYEVEDEDEDEDGWGKKAETNISDDLLEGGEEALHLLGSAN